MLETQLLYLQNPYMKKFTAQVTGTKQISGKLGVALDRTAFYPTGGGQPYDVGFLDQNRVVDVIEEDLHVYHIIDKGHEDDFALGKSVTGQIDWQRRFDHMQQHTGQHLLSAVLEKNYACETVGFHLGSDVVTIDIHGRDQNDLNWDDIEKEVNQIIFQNIAIEYRFELRANVDPELIAKVPQNYKYIRFVVIPQIDVNACRGTHPASTGELGLLKIIGTENNRQNVRVSFVVGWRALQFYQDYHQTIKTLTQQLKSPFHQLTMRVNQLKGENDDNHKRVRHLEQDLIQWEAAYRKERYTSMHAYKVHIKLWQERPFQELKDLAKTLIENDDRIVIFATKEPKGQLVAACAQNVSISMLDVINYMRPIINGRGGGNAVFAQLGGDGEQLEDALEQIVRWLHENM